MTLADDLKTIAGLKRLAPLMSGARADEVAALRAENERLKAAIDTFVGAYCARYRRTAGGVRNGGRCVALWAFS